MNLRWLVHPQLRQVGDHKAIPLVPGTDHAKSMKVRLQYRAAVRFSRSRTRWCGFIDIHREAGSTKTRFAMARASRSNRPVRSLHRESALGAISQRAGTAELLVNSAMPAFVCSSVRGTTTYVPNDASEDPRLSWHFLDPSQSRGPDRSSQQEKLQLGISEPKCGRH